MDASSHGGGEKLPRARRLTRGSEIRSVFRQGKRSRTAHLDVFDSASPFAFSRLGLVVPRHRHSAVARNRLKRRLRELGRRMLLPELDRAELTRDVLIRVRREAYDAPFATLREEFERWLERRARHGRSS